MPTYYRQPRPVIAHQWFKNGDHPDDKSVPLSISTENRLTEYLSEGKVVRRFRHPNIPGEEVCSACGSTRDHHGWLEGGDNSVCPGDYVVTLNPDRCADEAPKYGILRRATFEGDYLQVPSAK